jgi:hypothetical protein
MWGGPRALALALRTPKAQYHDDRGFLSKGGELLRGYSSERVRSESEFLVNGDSNNGDDPVFVISPLLGARILWYYPAPTYRWRAVRARAQRASDVEVAEDGIRSSTVAVENERSFFARAKKYAMNGGPDFFHP